MLFPTSIAIETVNFCNCKCIFCPLYQGNDQIDRSVRPRAVMNINLFKKIVCEVRSFTSKPETIYLNMDGEPLLDPLFEERLYLLSESGLSSVVDLQTNAALMTESVSENILRSGIRRVVIGFDGATKKTYEGHRIGSHYEQVLENIARFTRIRDSLKSSTGIAIKYVRTKRNADEVLDAYRMFCKILHPTFDSFYDTLSKRWGGAPEEYDTIIIDNIPDSAISMNCPALDRDMIILADGRVAACCWDYNLTVAGSLGNINQDTILSVWNGHKFQALRALWIEKRPEKCLLCVYPRKQLSIDMALLNEKKLVQIGVDGFSYALRKEVKQEKHEMSEPGKHFTYRLWNRLWKR